MEWALGFDKLVKWTESDPVSFVLSSAGTGISIAVIWWILGKGVETGGGGTTSGGGG